MPHTQIWHQVRSLLRIIFWMNSAAGRELIEDQVSFCFVILISWFSSIHTGIMGSQYICIVFGL